MKTLNHATLFILLNLIIIFNGFSQVAINTDGASPNASAMLDVQSTSKGILISRMLETERTGIPSPAKGLLVYQTDNTDGFYCFNGTVWQYIGNENNNLWSRNTTNIATILSNSTDNVGIGTSNPTMKLDVRGFATTSNMVSSVMLWQAANEYDVTNTTFQDLSNCETGFEPSVYEQNGDVEIKLIINLTASVGTGNEFQLTAQYWNGSSVVSTTLISNTDSWTWGQTNNVPYQAVVTSQWKTWNAGTHAWQIHLNGKKSTDSGSSLKFNSAYVLIRPKQS
ncbi:MAG: hypothetical protein GXO80_03495 [Chlorobi bacterium]|nr:hypothetical protein [Chlorobiota bacterium]